MRVIAGEARGVPLVAPKGEGTRPTSDLLKGAIFSSLGAAGARGRVLDLFAGSGALGIEALSRGASWCDFVESAEAACRAIQTNLERTKLSDRARIHCRPVQRFLASALSGGPAEPYDLILMDPPYALDVGAVLDLVGTSRLVAERTLVVVEHSSRRQLPDVAGRLRKIKTRTHGDSAFSVYLMDAPAPGAPRPTPEPQGAEP
jgi:16S rRNA (guanine966-N2)-methyltransferase